MKTKHSTTAIFLMEKEERVGGADCFILTQLVATIVLKVLTGVTIVAADFNL